MKFGYSGPILISAAVILIAFCRVMPAWRFLLLSQFTVYMESLRLFFLCILHKFKRKESSVTDSVNGTIAWWFLNLYSNFILLTILSGCLGELRIKVTVGLLLAPWPPSALILCGIDQDWQEDQSLLPYCPATIDMYDGIEMQYTKLNPTNPVWIQIAICLAVIMFYIPSFLEMYRLKFPELKSGSILSERKIKLCQFVCSCIFLVVRIMLYAYNPQEIIFAAKTFIRVYCHYKAWSNMNPAPQIGSIQATEILTEKALSLVSESPSLYYMHDYREIRRQNTEMQRSTPQGLF